MPKKRRKTHTNAKINIFTHMEDPLKMKAKLYKKTIFKDKTKLPEKCGTKKKFQK